MRYAVVIPYYNNHLEIQCALSGILAQSILPELIVVVDDASTIAFASLLSDDSFPKYSANILVLTHSTNRGVACSRNTGISACMLKSLDYIAFCDSDDAWYPDKMQLQLLLFSHTSVLAVACSVNGAKTSPVIRPNQVSSLSARDLLLRNYIQPSTLIVKASAFSLVGAFPSGRRYAEEGDLYNRIAESGTILFLSTPLVYYNTRSALSFQDPVANPIPSSQLSANIFRMYFGNLLNINACFKRGALSFPSAFFFSALLLARFIARLFSLFLICLVRVLNRAWHAL